VNPAASRAASLKGGCGARAVSARSAARPPRTGRTGQGAERARTLLLVPVGGSACCRRAVGRRALRAYQKQPPRRCAAAKRARPGTCTHVRQLPAGSSLPGVGRRRPAAGPRGAHLERALKVCAHELVKPGRDNRVAARVGRPGGRAGVGAGRVRRRVQVRQPPHARPAVRNLLLRRRRARPVRLKPRYAQQRPCRAFALVQGTSSCSRLRLRLAGPARSTACAAAQRRARAAPPRRPAKHHTLQNKKQITRGVRLLPTARAATLLTAASCTRASRAAGEGARCGGERAGSARLVDHVLQQVRRLGVAVRAELGDRGGHHIQPARPA